MDIKSRRGFEKALVEELPPFDESQIQINFIGKLYEGVNLRIKINGKWESLHMYLSYHNILQWKWQLTDYIKYGVFDMRAYHFWKSPKKSGYIVSDLENTKYNFFNASTSDFSRKMNEIRSKNGDTGFKLVERPFDLKPKVEDKRKIEVDRSFIHRMLFECGNGCKELEDELKKYLE